LLRVIPTHRPHRKPTSYQDYGCLRRHCGGLLFVVMFDGRMFDGSGAIITVGLNTGVYEAGLPIWRAARVARATMMYFAD
jgi:hypothetical protein